MGDWLAAIRRANAAAREHTDKAMRLLEQLKQARLEAI